MEKAFFETTFEEWWSTRMSMSRATALEVWKREGFSRWSAIKASDHWHGGVPCVNFEGCKRYNKHAPSIEV